MTTTELQPILKELHTLDQFASQAPLPRQWHANWQGLYQQVVVKVEAIAAEKHVDKMGNTSPGP